jgi:hypothetical protein
MYIGSLVIVALVGLVIAMVMFVKTCSIMSCTARSGNKTAMQIDAWSGGKK